MHQHTVIVPVSVGVASNSAGAGVKNTKRAKTMASSMESRPGLLEMCPNRREFAQAHWKFDQVTWKFDQVLAEIRRDYLEICPDVGWVSCNSDKK